MAAAIRQRDVGAIQQANRAFHQALLDACGAPRLRTILQTMVDMPILVRSFDLSTPEELRQSLHHHEDLVLAVEAADAELAQQVMQLHLRVTYRRFITHRSQYRAARTDAN